ncbi:SGNH/GDSL hydrolase family protein [Nocardia sp. NPDC052566]|uniref:SGNH/GDSL hydrolase family protein n=1 Tax=Nocardia sp. NPDC052566 TaxID=3364330 RepID=UPI0037CCBF2C
MTAAATLPTAEETDPYCLSPLDAAALLYDAPWRRFAVLGDSLSAGIGDPSPGYASLGWADRVADVLRRVHPGLAYLNTAVTRASTAQALERQADRIRAFDPDLLHVPSGANDIVRREPDFAEIESTMRRMYRFAASTGALIATFTLSRRYDVPVFPDWHERVLRINDITRALTAEFDAVLVDSEDHPISDRANLLSEDGIHFATAGQAVLAAEVVKALAHRLDADGRR